MKEIAKHEGTVLSTQQGAVKVLVTTMSACGSCSAHAHCGFSENRDREMVIDTSEWEQYHQGDKVEVSVNERLGFIAVWWAYIAPAMLLLGCIMSLLAVMDSEPLAVLITLAAVALYFLVLSQFKGRLQRRFSFGISKVGNQ
ncbi:MAG: SoxR reducing system RseC family protein [Bacteroidales bacterium]|nr:SoxR reducing system RseC family protein [Bacteroidales bacterium]